MPRHSWLHAVKQMAATEEKSAVQLRIVQVQHQQPVLEPEVASAVRTERCS